MTSLVQTRFQTSLIANTVSLYFYNMLIIFCSIRIYVIYQSGHGLMLSEYLNQSDAWAMTISVLIA